VRVDPERLRAAGLGVPDVVRALQAQNLAAPVGRLEQRYREQTIRLLGRLDTPEQFAQVVVAERGGAPIRLGQVAAVLDGRRGAAHRGALRRPRGGGHRHPQGQGPLHHRGGRGGARPGGRAAQGAAADVELKVVVNSGERVAQAVFNVEEALLLGALLTVLVVFLFLNSWRSTVITGLALP
jgi:HAE1 family hydrophobic/amphiphilic exporter-1